jgi:hypothetical protein
MYHERIFGSKVRVRNSAQVRPSAWPPIEACRIFSIQVLAMYFFGAGEDPKKQNKIKHETIKTKSTYFLILFLRAGGGVVEKILKKNIT